MPKFNAEFWLSVQFFPASLANMERRMDAEKWELYMLQARGRRSVSTISAEQREENNLVSKHIVSKESAGRDTLWPSLKVPVDYHFGVFRPEKRFSAAEWKTAFEKPTFLDGRHLFGKYFNNHKRDTLLTSTERPVQRTISEAAPHSSRHQLLSAFL
jgi:hypothetical protein